MFLDHGATFCNCVVVLDRGRGWVSFVSLPQAFCGRRRFENEDKLTPGKVVLRRVARRGDPVGGRVSSQRVAHRLTQRVAARDLEPLQQRAWWYRLKKPC